MKKKIVEAENRVKQGPSQDRRVGALGGSTRLQSGETVQHKATSLLPQAREESREAAPLLSKGHGLSRAVTAPLLSKGHGLSRAVTDRGEAPPDLPKAASTRPAWQMPLCKYIHLDGRRCQNPVHRKPRTTELGLCFQHCIRLRLHPVMEARRAANALRASAEKVLLAQRRVHRAANSARARYDARIQRERAAFEILRLDSPDAVLHVRDNLDHATRLGIFPPRDAECMRQLLFLAAKNLKENPPA